MLVVLQVGRDAAGGGISLEAQVVRLEGGTDLLIDQAALPVPPAVLAQSQLIGVAGERGAGGIIVKAGGIGPLEVPRARPLGSSNRVWSAAHPADFYGAVQRPGTIGPGVGKVGADQVRAAPQERHQLGVPFIPVYRGADHAERGIALSKILAHPA